MTIYNKLLLDSEEKEVKEKHKSAIGANSKIFILYIYTAIGFLLLAFLIYITGYLLAGHRGPRDAPQEIMPSHIHIQSYE